MNTSSFAFAESYIALCDDDDICKVLDLNEAACNVFDIKEKCCRSCTKCNDELVCESYTPISIFCRMSKEIRRKCPKSCGFCSAQLSKYLKINPHIISVVPFNSNVLAK